MKYAIFFSLMALTMILASACSDSNCHSDSETCDEMSSTSSETQPGVGGAGGGGGGDTLANDYCFCFKNPPFKCHDEYHAKFGPETNEPAARAACLAEAEGLPRVGMDTDMGNSLECRYHHCLDPDENATVCAAMLGEPGSACAP